MARIRVCAVECKALADELEAEDGMFGATVGRRKSCRFRASGLPVPAMVITVLWGVLSAARFLPSTRF